MPYIYFVFLKSFFVCCFFKKVFEGNPLLKFPSSSLFYLFLGNKKKEEASNGTGRVDSNRNTKIYILHTGNSKIFYSLLNFAFFFVIPATTAFFTSSVCRANAFQASTKSSPSSTEWSLLYRMLTLVDVIPTGLCPEITFAVFNACLMRSSRSLPT